MQNILERNIPNEQANRVKYRHLAVENNNLQLTVKELQMQIESLRAVNTQLMRKMPASIQILIDAISQQNQRLENSLFRLIKNNQELSCEVLMKNQLICEAERQHRDIIASFEEKIYELRVSIQHKELTVCEILDKQNEGKEEIYGPSTSINVMYFNEMSQLKNMLDRLSVQNSQLSFLNTMKNQQIERQKQMIDKFQAILGKQSSISANVNQQTRAKKVELKNKLEEEMTRYDIKYKSKNIATPNLITNLKFMLTQLSKRIRDLSAENAKLLKNMKGKQKEYKILQEAYKKMKDQFAINQIEVQFYRQNFKELSKVTTERKIKFFDQQYCEIIPTLERRLHYKENIIKYWKHWLNTKDEILTKRIINKESTLRKTSKRSNSCCFRYSYTKEVSRKICMEPPKEEAVFSFINETHNVDSIINFTIDEKQNGAKNQKIFNDDISVIIKPSASSKSDHRKKKRECE